MTTTSPSLLGINLLANPGAETGDITGWMSEQSLPGDPPWGASVQDPRSGTYHFAGGSTAGPGGTTKTLIQELDLLALGFEESQLDSGLLVEVGGWQSGPSSLPDWGRIVVEFSAQPGHFAPWHPGLTTGPPTTGPPVSTTTGAGPLEVFAGPRIKLSDWRKIHHVQQLPIGTRYIRYMFTAEKWYNATDAYLDDAFVVIFEPGFGTNLLANPGAESGSIARWTSAQSSPNDDPFGATFTDGDWFVFQKIPAYEGVYIFNPGDTDGQPGATKTLSQDVALLDWGFVDAGAIDAGGLYVEVSGRQRGTSGMRANDFFSDRGRICLDFFDAAGDPVAAATTTPGQSSWWCGQWVTIRDFWKLVRRIEPVPPGTRTIRYSFVAQFISGEGSDDDIEAYLDDAHLSLLDGPPPPGEKRANAVDAQVDWRLDRRQAAAVALQPDWVFTRGQAAAAALQPEWVLAERRAAAVGLMVDWRPAALTGRNLLVNPGAEDGDLTGWSSEHEPGDGPFGVGDGGHGGSFHFTGGESGEGAGAAKCLMQQVDLLAEGFSPALLDSGVFVEMGGWIGCGEVPPREITTVPSSTTGAPATTGPRGTTPPPEECAAVGQFTVEFLDAPSGDILGAWTSDSFSPAGFWEEVKHVMTLPPGTREIRFRFCGTATDPSGNINVHLDDALLVVGDEGQTAPTTPPRTTTAAPVSTTTGPPLPHPADQGPGEPDFHLQAEEVADYIADHIRGLEAGVYGIPAASRTEHLVQAVVIFAANAQGGYEDVRTALPPSDQQYPLRWRPVPDP